MKLAVDGNTQRGSGLPAGALSIQVRGYCTQSETIRHEWQQENCCFPTERRVDCFTAARDRADDAFQTLQHTELLIRSRRQCPSTDWSRISRLGNARAWLQQKPDSTAGRQEARTVTLKMHDLKMADKLLANCEHNYGVWKMQE